MAHDVRHWLLHALSQLNEIAFGAETDYVHRFLAMVLVVALIAVPCAILATTARSVLRVARRAIAQAEALHPLVLDGVQDDPAAPHPDIPLGEMSFAQLAEALRAADQRVQRARTIRARDKERRKHSVLLWLVDAVFITRYEAALNAATKHHKELETHARGCARAWVQQRTCVLATATPELAEQHRQLAGAVDAATQQANLTQKWVRRASAARDAMLAAKRCCQSASTTEFFDAISKNKAVSFMSWSETSGASRAVDKAKRAVDALRRSLPARGQPLGLDTRIHVPDAFFALVVDILVSPTFDLVSWWNMSALDGAARKCDRAAEALAQFGRHARALADEAAAQLQTASAAKAAHEAPYSRAACGELPARLQTLV
jgi:hypothetical protein